jgi:multiple sugar transport system permease protein
VIPATLFYLLFRFYPVGYAFYMSVHDWQLLRSEQFFIGLDNYRTILADPLFRKVIWNTLYFALVTTFAGGALALVLAMVLNPIRWGSSGYRLVYFLPVITSTIAIATIWLWIYQPRFGLLNQLLSMVGLGRVGWLTSPQWAMPSLILMSIWGGVGYTMVIFLAGLRGIPGEYYEAAEIDGASGWQMAWRITLPLLSPVITFVLVTSLIGGFNVFQQVYLMTRGGPLDATRVLALHIYEYAFQRLWMGQAAAMAFVLFALVMALTLVQLRLRRIDWAM